MNNCRSYLIIACAVTLAFFALSTTAFAVFKTGGAPASKASAPPYGLSAQENAAGTKLIGVLQISFTNLGCNEDLQADSGLCSDFGPNVADARVFLRLSTTNAKINSTKSFYIDLGMSPIYSIKLLQDAVLAALKPEILDAFFDADCANDVNCDQSIYLKTFTNYSEANISTAPSDDPSSEFSCIADITLAVD